VHEDLDLKAIADASLRAIDEPGGQEILDRMTDGHMPVLDGLVALLILSGDYRRLPEA